MEDKLNYMNTFRESVSNSIFDLIGKKRKHQNVDEDDVILREGEPSSSIQKGSETDVKANEKNNMELVIDLGLHKCTCKSSQSNTNALKLRQSSIDLLRGQEFGNPNLSFIVDRCNGEKEELTSQKPFLLTDIGFVSSGSDHKDDIDKETYDLCLSYLLSKHSDRFEDDESSVQYSTVCCSEFDSDSIDGSKLSEFISKHYRQLCYPPLDDTVFDYRKISRDSSDYDDVESQTTLWNACSLEFSSKYSNSFNIGMIEALSDYVLECYRAIFNGSNKKKVESIYSEPILLTYENKDAEKRMHGYSENMFSLSAISAQSQFLSSNGSLQETHLKNLFINGSYNTVCSSTTHYSESNFVVGDKESSFRLLNMESESTMSLFITKKGEIETEYFDDISYSKTSNKETNEECYYDSKENRPMLEQKTATTPERSSKSNDKYTSADDDGTKEDAVAKTSGAATFENQNAFGNMTESQDVLYDIDMRKLVQTDTDQQDDNGIVSRKTLEILYPVKPNEDCCLSCQELEAADQYEEPETADKSESPVKFHPCMTGDYIDNSEIIEEEDELEVGVDADETDEECMTDYDGRGGESDCISNQSETWSFIDTMYPDETDDRRDKFKSVFNNSEFKDGVLNVLEDFLKENYLISNMKSDDYDVYIIPKNDTKNEQRRQGNSKASRSSPATSRLYKCYSLGCNQYDTEPRSRGSRRSPRTIATPKYRKGDVDDFYDLTALSSENYYYDLNQRECIDSNKFRSWPLFHPKRMQSASHRTESECKRRFHTGSSNAHFGNTDTSNKGSVSHSVGDNDNYCDVDGQNTGNKTVKLIKPPNKRKPKSILEELNNFKRVLSEVERRQNALLQLLCCDPCGLSYNFPRENFPNRNVI